MASIEEEVPRAGDPKRWWVAYPVYINDAKKKSEGRRLPKSMCATNPTANEIGEICEALRLKYIIERDKAYSRDFTQRGRVRMLLKDDDGTPCNPEIKNKKSFLIFAGTHINKLKTRSQKAGQEAADTKTAGGGGKKKRMKWRFIVVSLAIDTAGR